MREGTKVEALSIVHLGFIGKAWSDYGNKIATAIDACSNDRTAQCIKFDDGHTVYWPTEYLRIIK